MFYIHYHIFTCLCQISMFKPDFSIACHRLATPTISPADRSNPVPIDPGSCDCFPLGSRAPSGMPGIKISQGICKRQILLAGKHSSSKVYQDQRLAMLNCSILSIVSRPEKGNICFDRSNRHTCSLHYKPHGTAIDGIKFNKGRRTTPRCRCGGPLAPPATQPQKNCICCMTAMTGLGR